MKNSLETLMQKASILSEAEALPYINKFRGKTFLIKCSGSVIEGALDTFAQNIALLNYIGIKPIVVHGGSIEISRRMKDVGIEPKFKQGRRVTDGKTIEIVKTVLSQINDKIVTLINQYNNHGSAVGIGLSGLYGGLLTVKPIKELGLVGEVDKVNTSILENLQSTDFIPIIEPIGVDLNGTIHNINSDNVASSVATALKAEKLFLLTNVPGIQSKKGETFSTLDTLEVDNLIKNGTISDGMLPKVQSCVKAINNGVSKIHIIDGNIPHALLLEIFTTKGIGTEIIAQKGHKSKNPYIIKEKATENTSQPTKKISSKSLNKLAQM